MLHRHRKAASIFVGLACLGLAAQAAGPDEPQRADRQTSATIRPGEACPTGMTMTRPGRCQAPELPPPSIVDYRPRSTLVTEESRVASSRFPVVDIHSHTGPSADTIDRLIGEMDGLNLRVLVNLSGGSDPAAVKEKVDFIRASEHPDRFRVFANVEWDGAGAPGWAEKAVADLERAVDNGAIGSRVRGYPPPLAAARTIATPGWSGAMRVAR